MSAVPTQLSMLTCILAQLILPIRINRWNALRQSSGFQQHFHFNCFIAQNYVGEPSFSHHTRVTGQVCLVCLRPSMFPSISKSVSLTWNVFRTCARHQLTVVLCSKFNCKDHLPLRSGSHVHSNWYIERIIRPQLSLYDSLNLRLALVLLKYQILNGGNSFLN